MPLKNNDTDYLVRSFAVCIENRVRAEDILKLSPTAKHAQAVKAAQRKERAALTALNKHLKAVVKEHKKQLRECVKDAEEEIRSLRESYQ